MGLFERSSVGHVNIFSQTDLLQYVESLLKESSAHKPPEGNYSWLRSRHIHHDYSKDLETFKPIVSKMTSESCAIIAVKLDGIAEDNLTTASVLGSFRRLLLEQHSIQLMMENVTRANRNRVLPDLGPRQATVSFVLD